MEANGEYPPQTTGAIAVKPSPTDARMPLLWEDPASELGGRSLLNKIKWSYSRRSVLEQCPRRYYYEYYGAGGRKANADPDKATVRFLKSLQNRHERAGTIAHLIISTYFRKGQSGDVWGSDRLCRWAQDMFRKDCTYSRAHPDGSAQPPGHFPPVLLQEYYYHHPDASAVCAEAEERLVNGLRTFHTSLRFAEFRSAGIRPGALIEQNLVLPGFPFGVDGKLDLAFTAGNHVTVVDWKTGEPSGSGDESLQLATYALWASGHFAAQPESITVWMAFLNADDVAPIQVNKNLLADARARILQDAERMAVLQQYGERHKVEAFSPCAQVSVCALCPFREICPEGRGVLHA